MTKVIVEGKTISLESQPKIGTTESTGKITDKIIIRGEDLKIKRLPDK